MDTILENTNSAELSGIVVSLPEVSHKSYGEAFYKLTMGIKRKSDYLDLIQVIVSERLIWNLNIVLDDSIRITGQIRTYNETDEGRNKLIVVVFAREFELCDIYQEEDISFENRIYLEGFICKPPVKRVSPLGREICDVMLAVNRMYNKSDYIPCIAWGRNATYAADLEVGAKIAIWGRLQSREYRKKDEFENIKVKTAYEVSILKIED